MKLSVVVPTFGKRALVERTLRSLARQDAPPPFEVIVVEDGADPGMAEFVASLALPLELTVFVHPKTRGRAATRNKGIAAAGGDVVVFLDGDMEVVPGFLAAHRTAHEAGRTGAGARTVVLGCILTAPEIARSAFVRYIDSRGVHKIPPGTPIPPRYFMTGNSSVAAAAASCRGRLRRRVRRIRRGRHGDGLPPGGTRRSVRLRAAERCRIISI